VGRNGARAYDGDEPFMPHLWRKGAAEAFAAEDRARAASAAAGGSAADASKKRYAKSAFARYREA
jgi:hypothetical protein